MRRYEEGTLLIDFVDARTKQLIWRGWAVGVIENVGIIASDPEKAEKKISSAVRKILEHFPPQEE